MMLRDTEIRGLIVVTKSGEKLGKLVGLVVDSNTHGIVHYVVAKSRFISALLPSELIIHTSQVIAFDTDRMIVKDDTVAVAAEEESASSRRTAPGAVGMTRSME